MNIINYFSFKGRIRRQEYFISLLILSLIMTFVENITKNAVPFFSAVCYTLILWLLLSQGAKRCHDIGISGWWQIIPFYIITLIFYKGDEHKNEYGQSPKAKKGGQLLQ
jgi:uncharacterized membrane protein YhaH (DUF805 family)